MNIRFYYYSKEHEEVKENTTITKKKVVQVTLCADHDEHLGWKEKLKRDCEASTLGKGHRGLSVSIKHGYKHYIFAVMT